jgi:putative ABC transport system permease protein
MIGKLVYENVRHRPMRTALSVLLIAVGVTAILTLVGLSRGYIEDSSRRTRGTGADLIMRPQGASAMQFSGATLQRGIVDFIARQPHVTIATGVISHPFEGWNQVTGIEPTQFDAMSGGFTYLAGHGLEQPDDVLLDSYYADQKHKKAGQTITLINKPWHIAGIVEPGKLSHVFVSAPVLQELDASTGKYSLIYIKVDDPQKNLNAVLDSLKQRFPGYPIDPLQALLSNISVDNIPFLKPFINVIIGVGVLIAITVVWRSM